MYLQLDDLDEIRAAALDHMIAQKKRVTRGYNKHVRVKQFAIGNLVWKTVFLHNTHTQAFGKWSPT